MMLRIPVFQNLFPRIEKKKKIQFKIDEFTKESWSFIKIVGQIAGKRHAKVCNKNITSSVLSTSERQCKIPLPSTPND